MVVIVLTACPVGLRGDLTRWLLDTMGAPEAPVAYEAEIQAAYDARMQEFLSPKTKFQL